MILSVLKLKMSLDAPLRSSLTHSQPRRIAGGVLLCNGLLSSSLGVLLAVLLLIGPRVFGQGTSDPPQITVQPQDQSVSSGSNVVFSVSAVGTQPLGFQWREAAPGATLTNISKANSATLVLSNVSVLNAGSYAVVVTNAFGAVTSTVVRLSVDEDLAFRIAALQTNGFIVTEAYNIVGYTRGGMAVSSNNVFLTGYGQNFAGAVTGRWRKQDLSAGAITPQGYDALASDLRTEKAYTLANGGAPLTGPGTVTALIEISDTGALTGNRINLSTNITISGNETGIFAGYARIVLYDSGRFYNISMPSGVVTYLGNRRINHNYPYYGNALYACWGMAEYFRGDISVICGQGSSIYRYRVRDGFSELVAGFGPFEQGLSSVYCLAFSPSLSRWYFHYPFEGLFGPLTTTLGSAKALFTRDSGFPDITQDPQSTTVNAGSPVTLSVYATGDNLTYQWRFNSDEIQGATNATLTIANALPTDAGTYRVAVSTAAGTAVSKPAVLTVLSVPVISFGPLNFTVEANSTVTNFVTALGPAPLSFQWQFNGTPLAGETNASLQLTNVQTAQQGVYSVVVSNSWGTTISADARLRLITIFPEGASFRIASLGTANSKVIEDRDVIFGEYGGITPGLNRIIYAGSSAMELLDLENLSNRGTGTGTLYPTIASDLRTGTAYAFARTNSPIAYGGLATHLLELDTITGRTNGHRVALSTAIPMPNNYPGYMNVGFFSGYGRILVFNETNVFNISLPSGSVSNLGPLTTPTHYSQGWGFWGVAEYFGGTHYLVYVRDSQTISRTRLPDGSTTTLARFQSLGSMSHFTVSLYHDRWYFHYPGGAQFGGTYQTFGYADATFEISPVHHYEWGPISSPQVAGLPFDVTLTAKAIDNSTVSNYTGNVVISGTAGGKSVPLFPPVVEVDLVDGVWNGQITVPQPVTAMSLNALDSRGVTGTSGAFDVFPLNDVFVTISDAPDPVVIGQPLSYTITVINTGPAAASGVVLTNFLPASFVLQAVNSSVGSCTNDGGIVQCDLGMMAGATAATIVIQGLPSAVGTITNAVTIARADSDANITNNSAMAITTVNLPALSINDVSVVEGNSGTNPVTFTVTLSVPATNTVTVNFTTFNGSASGSSDYIATNGTLSFAPGVTNQTLQVRVRGDTLYETNETFNVGLNTAVNAIVVRNAGVCTIINDDPAPSVSISDATQLEGNSGTNNMAFQVRLSAPTGVQILVNYSTSNGTATAGSDYLPLNGALSFGAGSLNLTQNIQVPIIGDTIAESNEFFYVNLTSVSNALAVRTQAIGTILNEDGFGVLHHFDFSPIPSPQAVGLPFPITLTAKDYFETTISNFNATVALSALADFEAVTNVAVGDVDDNGSGTGDYTIGFAFTPLRDLTITHFRHFWGTKISVWSDNGTLLASQSTPGGEGAWTEIQLSTPLNLTGGSQYRIAAYSGGGSYYLAPGTPPTGFPDGTIDQNVYGMGDIFPTNVTSALFLVDFRYRYETYVAVSLVPTNSGTFSDGTWSGMATLFTTATNVTLRARSTGQIAGVSVPFDVIAADQADVIALFSTGTQPAPYITNFTYTLQVSNAGPATASSLLVTHAVPGALNFISATAIPSGACTYSNGVVTCTLPDLSPRGSASVTINSQPLLAGPLTLSAAVNASQIDPNPGNNLASLAVTICRDCDGDGMWDDWELANGLNPNDSSDGSLDNDHDGHTNLQEFLAGTDPNSSNSVIRISQVLVSGSDLRIRFNGVTGKRYRLERSSGMNGSNWTPVVVFKIGTSRTIDLIDSSAMLRPGAFYRVHLVP